MGSKSKKMVEWLMMVVGMEWKGGWDGGCECENGERRGD
jgi:hypothetical protein